MKVLRAIILVGLLTVLIVPILLTPYSTPTGPATLEGKVLLWPRQNYAIISTERGRVAVTRPEGTTPYAGDYVQVWGTWSVPTGTFGLWLRSENLLGWVYTNSLRVKSTDKPWYISFLVYMRLYIEGTLRSPIARSMLLGDRSGVPEDVQESFDAAGTSHLLAASGLHLGILSGLIYLILGRKRGRWAIIITAVVYIIMTGFRVSMVRAALMVTLGFLPIRLHRFERLGVALCIILLMWPQAIFGVGLWLSFSATASILLIVPLLSKLKGVIKYPVGTIITTTACQLATLPITLYVFGRAAFPIGIVTNAVAIPLGTCVLATAFFSILIPYPLNYPIVLLNSFLSSLLVDWIGLFT